jgi:hypothetical protein
MFAQTDDKRKQGLQSPDNPRPFCAYIRILAL